MIFSRQAEFIHGVAVIAETFSGIDHWWIGLTDLGKQVIKGGASNTLI